MEEIVHHGHGLGRQRSEPSTTAEMLIELRAMRREQVAFRRFFDEFARAFLNAKFPHGKATDRWARHR